jgi:hypothetical protein
MGEVPDFTTAVVKELNPYAVAWYVFLLKNGSVRKPSE